MDGLACLKLKTVFRYARKLQNLRVNAIPIQSPHFSNNSGYPFVTKTHPKYPQMGRKDPAGARPDFLSKLKFHRAVPQFTEIGIPILDDEKFLGTATHRLCGRERREKARTRIRALLLVPKINFQGFDLRFNKENPRIYVWVFRWLLVKPFHHIVAASEHRVSRLNHPATDYSRSQVNRSFRDHLLTFVG